MLKRLNQLDLPYALTVVVLALMALGTVFVFSAGVNLSSEITINNFLSSVRFRNIIFFLLAVPLLYAASTINYRWFNFDRPVYKSLTPYLLTLALVLLVLVLIPGIGTEINQARRWLRLNIGGFSVNFQPSELAKWATIFFLAAYLDKSSRLTKSNLRCFLSVCTVVGLTIALIITQDFGTAAFISLLTFLMLVISGAALWHFLAVVPFLATAFYFVVVQSPTRINRIKAFLDPQSYAGTIGYQARQSLVAISTAGLFGKGLGRGISNYGHLPEDTTDFIFSIIAHELGFVGAAIVILLYIAFVVFGTMVVIRCRDRFGKMLACGIIMCLSIQAAINIGVVTVVLPTKGIPLPFVSAGGTSLLLSAIAVGVLINIAKQNTGINNLMTLKQRGDYDG